MNAGERRLCDYFANRSGSFFKKFFDAAFNADTENLVRLMAGFPEEAVAVKRYQQEEGYWPRLEAEYKKPGGAE